jgi:lyso-ornithine lipid O-acyltransferase
VTVSWNEAKPAALPPLTMAERLRLGLRATASVLTLAVLFAIFLPLRGIDRLLTGLFGRPVTRFGPAIVKLWAGLALATLGLRHVQRGRPMRGAGAFVANHASWIDIVVLQRASAPFLVAKSEVRDWPVIGLIGRAIGTLFIDRKSVAAKRQEAELLERLARGDHMALFPEGTSTDGQRVLPFKSSLFGVFFAPSLGGLVSAQPVAIVYRTPPGLPVGFYGWWGGMDFAGHLREVLARSVGGAVEVSFLEPVQAAGVEGRKQMAEICWQRVEREFAQSHRGDEFHPET